MSSDTLSRQVGQWAANVTYDQIPEYVREQALLNILDAVGIAFASTHYDFANKSIAAARALGTGEHGAIAMPHKFTVRDQAMINGLLMHGLDFDDTHVAGVIHATVSALPTAIAVATDKQLSGQDLILGYLIGLEVSARVAAAADGGFHAAGFHPTGLVGAFGAATAAAAMLGLDAEGISQAQGIVGSMAGGSLEFLETGAWTKRLHPGWAAFCGITAAELARAEFEGPPAIYEGRFGLFNNHTLSGHKNSPEMIVAGLGSVWELMNVAIKPYAACHFTHACLDMAIELTVENDLKPEDIAHVITIVPAQVVPVVCEPMQAKLIPRSDYDAKFSLPFIIGTAISRRRFTLMDLDNASLADPITLELASKVVYEADPNPTFPKYFHGEVIIETTDGRTLRKREDVNRGAEGRPLSAAEVEQKFCDNMALVTDEKVTNRVFTAVMDLAKTANARDFNEALRLS